LYHGVDLRIVAHVALERQRLHTESLDLMCARVFRVLSNGRRSRQQNRALRHTRRTSLATEKMVPGSDGVSWVLLADTTMLQPASVERGSVAINEQRAVRTSASKGESHLTADTTACTSDDSDLSTQRFGVGHGWVVLALMMDASDSNDGNGGVPL